MDAKQLLERAYQDIRQLTTQVSTLKGKNTKQSNLIKQLTDALEALKKQYEDMLRASDKTIAKQAVRIKRLTKENQVLHRQLEEIKKNAA